jgi:hypothetical protein
MATLLSLHRVAAWLIGTGTHFGGSLRTSLRWCSQHTGVPVIVVAAVALVLAIRLARRWAHFALEVVVTVGVLLCATRLGWVKW